MGWRPNLAETLRISLFPKEKNKVAKDDKKRAFSTQWVLLNERKMFALNKLLYGRRVSIKENSTS